LRAFWEAQIERSHAADPLCQVMRSQHRLPVSAESFASVVEGIVAALEVEPHHRVLDLCCGNGLITAAIASRCRRLVAADFSVGMLLQVARRVRMNHLRIAADANQLEVRDCVFDRILIAAALQHFDEPAIVQLFRRMFRFLRPEGSLLVTDIPDRQKMWAFFDERSREDAYFASCELGDPILGTWIEGEWLRRLATHVGFKSSEVLAQPPSYPFAHYRFDLRCRK
jgi:ubiquinone/menaquinone biosynthesis C-methylase UbiE